MYAELAFGVFRRGEYMKKGLDELQEIEKVNQLHLKDKVRFHAS